jgi:hypothetical protein
MWNDLMLAPLLMTEVIMEFGSFWLTAGAPEAPPPGAVVALLLEHAPAATSTRLAKTARAVLGRRITVTSSLGICWKNTIAV